MMALRGGSGPFHHIQVVFDHKGVALGKIETYILSNPLRRPPFES